MKIQTQPDNYSCGIYSIINALLVYDDRKTRKEVKELSGTTYKNGTDENGIKNALTEFGYKSREYSTSNPELAWRWVLRNSRHNPLILCVDQDQHWIVVIGRIRNKVIIVGDKYTQIVSKPELLKRWNYWGLKIG